jgi:O-6-methylguanine DNA methyltransferase
MISKAADRILYYTVYHWKTVDFILVASDDGLCQLEFLNQRSEQKTVEDLEKRYGWKLKRNDPLFALWRSKLDKYFDGEPVTFDEPLDMSEGSDFQRRVWQRLRKIPYGQTVTYGQIAAEFGMTNGARAVGLANGANPIAIVIPCHRVIESNGKLGGYGGGLEVKDALLRLEGAII